MHKIFIEVFNQKEDFKDIPLIEPVNLGEVRESIVGNKLRNSLEFPIHIKNEDGSYDTLVAHKIEDENIIVKAEHFYASKLFSEKEYDYDKINIRPINKALATHLELETIKHMCANILNKAINNISYPMQTFIGDSLKSQFMDINKKTEELEKEQKRVNELRNKLSEQKMQYALLQREYFK